MTDFTIRLRSGRTFDFIDLDSNVVTIEDIASALAKINRFTGHTREPYSVAQHCVEASYLVPPEDAYAALMHDAVEFVMNDLSSPLKALLPEYKVLEKRIEAWLLPQFGLPPVMPESVKPIDLALCATEKRDVMPEPVGGPDPYHGISPHPNLTLIVMPWHVAEAEFLRRYYQLRPAA